MRLIKSILSISIGLFLSSTLLAYEEPTVDSSPAKQSLIELFNNYSPCCVRIRCTKEGKPCFLSGFFVSPDGYILTAVTHGSDFYVETAMGQITTAQKMGEDEILSICLLKANLSKEQTVPCFSLMRSAPPINIGESIVSLSCKLGQAVAPQKGYVTDMCDRCLGHEFPITYVRSTLPIESGDSGGAVLNRQGNLCGMLLHAIEGTRETFYIPQWALERIYQNLLILGHVPHGYAGMHVETCWDKQQNRVCLRIVSIDAGSPGEQYKFKVGDILTHLNGVELYTLEDLKNYLFLADQGGVLRFTVIRGNKTLKLSLKMRKHK